MLFSVSERLRQLRLSFFFPQFIDIIHSIVNGGETHSFRLAFHSVLELIHCINHGINKLNDAVGDNERDAISRLDAKSGTNVFRQKQRALW